jgi:hypothetical protein
MAKQTIKLVDDSGATLAVAEVDFEGDHYGGTIDITAAPPAVRALFVEFDEIVNGQMFSFLDEIEDKIAALGIKVLFDSGRAVPVKDLQVHTSTGDVAFKISEVAANGCVSERAGTRGKASA